MADADFRREWRQALFCCWVGSVVSGRERCWVSVKGGFWAEVYVAFRVVGFEPG